MNDNPLSNLRNWLQFFVKNFLGFSKRAKDKSLRMRLLAIVIFISLTACAGATSAPLEFAPNGDIIQQAIAQQLHQQLNPLSQQLNTAHPDLDIGQINVKKIESVVISELPTYHLQGTYHLKLILPHQIVEQKNNHFNIYLQRQAEGKTWRLLSKDNKASDETQWKSYLVGLPIPKN